MSSDEKIPTVDAAVVEKQIPQSQSQSDGETEDVLHEHSEKGGYLVDIEGGAHGKLAKDGHTLLIPQPSNDEDDPLNWSWNKKHLILFIVSITAFLPDYASATGAVTLIAQAQEWNMTPDEVNHSQAGNVFMLGAGGVFAVILAAYLGRLPVVFWFTLIGLGTAAWCAGATTFESFMAARILHGFFSTVCQVVGLIFIQDIFFFHERARKINIWASVFILSPYMGPLLGAFMLETQRWPVPFWVLTALSGFCFILICLFLEETYYDRRVAKADQPPQGNRVQRLIGIAQWKSRNYQVRNTFGQAVWRSFSVLLKPAMLLANIYQLLTFAWVIGINTTLSIFVTPLYGFGPREIGFFYFTPIVAILIGEAIGHWLHDFFAHQYIRTHQGRFEPEVRLRIVVISTPMMLVGLILLGHAFENGWHYMITSVCWGLYNVGIIITIVALSSYCLDSYPEASGEVSAWLNNSRTLSGFIISYFQVRWAEAQGTKVSFGIQAGIVAAAFLIILVLMKWGKKMRVWGGPLNFATS